MGLPEAPVVHPTEDEFSNFAAYVTRLEHEYGETSGIVRVVPPSTWTARKDGYDSVDFDIRCPIQQEAFGRGGVWQFAHVVRKKVMSVNEFKELANSEDYKRPVDHPEGDLDSLFWRNFRFCAPVYGADTPGSLFDPLSECPNWNVPHLPTLLKRMSDSGIQLPGINTPYLYVGMWRASFAWHTEDMDLYSINYIHCGAGKTWYSVPHSAKAKFEQVARDLFPDQFRDCSEFLRHKQFMISPRVLRSKNIPLTRTVHNAVGFCMELALVFANAMRIRLDMNLVASFVADEWKEKYAAEVERQRQRQNRYKRTGGAATRGKGKSRKRSRVKNMVDEAKDQTPDIEANGDEEGVSDIAVATSTGKVVKVVLPLRVNERGATYDYKFHCEKCKLDGSWRSDRCNALIFEQKDQIECEACQTWFHTKCLSLKKNTASFICPSCS